MKIKVKAVNTMLLCIIITAIILFVLIFALPRAEISASAEEPVISQESTVPPKDDGYGDISPQNIGDGDTNAEDLSKAGKFQNLSNYKFIYNKYYFLLNPMIHYNSKSVQTIGVCTSVAMEMLLGYFNYYVDRSIIAPRYLDSQYGDLAYNPYYSNTMVGDDNTNDDSRGNQYIGTPEVFYDLLMDCIG